MILLKFLFHLFELMHRMFFLFLFFDSNSLFFLFVELEEFTAYLELKLFLEQNFLHTLSSCSKAYIFTHRRVFHVNILDLLQRKALLNIIRLI